MVLNESMPEILVWLWKTISAGFIGMALYVWRGMRHDHDKLQKSYNDLRDQVGEMKIIYATKGDMKALKDEFKEDLGRVEGRLARIEAKHDARFDGVQAQLTDIAIAVRVRPTSIRTKGEEQ